MIVRHLLLIKHAQPHIMPDIPAREWQLSNMGCASCGALADKLRPFAPFSIATSTEPKAVQTAHIVADTLGIDVKQYDGLHEHDRRNVGYFPHKADFENAVRAFFAEPHRLTFGDETAAQALTRFRGTIYRVIADAPKGNIAIVAHGTVITLFIAAHNSIEPFELWQRLGLPSFIVLHLPDFSLEKIISSI